MTDKAATWQLRETVASWRPAVAVKPTPRPIIASSDWRVVVHESISEIDASRWDKVAGPRAVTRSHAYLEAIEAAGISGCRYYYPAIYGAHDEILAHACVYAIETDFAQLLPRAGQRLIDSIRRVWPSFLKTRLIECATPLFAGSSVSLSTGVERAQVIAVLDAVMVDLAARENSRLLVIRDFLRHECDGLEFLLETGYKCVSNLPLARVRVRWHSYDEYLGCMRARYRKDIKRRLQLAAKSGRSVEVLPAFAADAVNWARQAAAIYARAKGFKREAVNAAYYANMDRLLGQQSVLLVVNNNGQKIAHGMVVFDDESTIATFFGREQGPAGGEWFMLMNEVIRIGIERGSKYISLGLGSYDAKSIVGADIEPLYVYTRCTNPLVNALIKLIPDLMRRDEAHQRRLFRAAVGE